MSRLIPVESREERAPAEDERKVHDNLQQVILQTLAHVAGSIKSSTPDLIFLIIQVACEFNFSTIKLIKNRLQSTTSCIYAHGYRKRYYYGFGIT